MATFRIICILILEAIVVAVVVKKWCFRTRGPVASVGIAWHTRIIDGRTYIDAEGLISNIKAVCELIEKSESGPKP